VLAGRPRRRFERDDKESQDILTGALGRPGVPTCREIDMFELQFKLKVDLQKVAKLLLPLFFYLTT
jgi:hypothetical protein